MEKIGKLERVIFHNKENGYTVGVFETEDEQFTVTGSFHDPNPGVKYRIVGEFKMHRKYGEQFNAESYEEVIPDDADGIRAFLAAGNVKGIGPKMANLIVDRFGKSTLDVLEQNPEKLLEIRGIGPKSLKVIAESFGETIEFTKISFSLRELGITMAQAVRIYKLYGGESLEVVKDNPYCLVEDIYGISFRKADEIAMKLGFEEDSEFRLESGVAYVLENFAQSGSTYMPKEQLLESTVKLLDVGSEQVEECLVQMIFQGKLQTDTIEETPVVYLYGYYLAEQSVAWHLAQIKEAHIDPLSADLDNLIQDAEKNRSGGIHLSEEQRGAVRQALTENVCIITGGPGTGKTTIINTIVYILEQLDIKVALAAPTGRAAKRITETSGVEAMTIHRMLEYVYSEDEHEMNFGRNEENPLEEKAVIIDEASMVDLMLMEGLLKAVKPGTRLIIVGDADQLPSVGAGNVLRDMLRSEYIPAVRLHEIFRQAGESLIVVNAHMIQRGEYPYANESNKDFFVMRRSREEDILNTVEDLFRGRVQNYYDFIHSGYDIQVLTPTKKGLLGTIHLNEVLQGVLNPPSEEKREKKSGSRIFREGDKVMQLRNNYMMEWKRDGETEKGKGVFNGDMGRIEGINPESGRVSVRYDDRVVVYENEDLMELELAYAITVHKSQGSEFPAVVMPMTWFPPMLMTRNLLYTAVTRGKNLVVVVGSEDRMHAMVDNNRIDERYTGLEYRLRQIDFGNTIG